MKEYLMRFLTEYEFPIESHNTFIKLLDNIIKNEITNKTFNKILEYYSQDKDIKFNVISEKVAEIKKEINANEYSLMMLVFICLTKQLKENYNKFNYSDEIFRETVMDLKYKLIECKLVYNVWGTFVAEWFINFFNLTRFALGILQFEIKTFNKDYIVGEEQLSKDGKYINVHIPRTGNRLDYQEVIKSYEKASLFFKEQFADGPMIFGCCSWLLFPPVKKFYKESSNLYKFSSDYEVLSFYEDYDYNEVWRLFDKKYNGNVNDLPQDTSLRVKVAEMIKNNEKFGGGFGVYIYKK